MCIPIKVTAIYYGTTYTGSMSVHIFSCRVYYNVSSPFKWAAIDRGGEGVVYNQRYTMIVGDAGEFFDVEYLEIVSPNSALVFGRKAEEISSSGESGLTKVTSIPSFFKVTPKRLNVPP